MTGLFRHFSVCLYLAVLCHSVSTAFAFAPLCKSPLSATMGGTVRKGTIQTTRMMAERFYNKWSRADFVLKSALAAAGIIPVVKGGAVASKIKAEHSAPVKTNKKHSDEKDDEEKTTPLAFSTGVPLRYPSHKSQYEARRELQDVVARVGGRLTDFRGTKAGLFRATFDPHRLQELYFEFGGDGGSSGYSRVLRAHVGAGVDDMRLINALADGLASKGWLTAGFPLSCDPAMAQYV